MFGVEGLCHRAGNHHYSKEIKCEAVEVYLSGRMSEEDICKKYQIRSRTQLEKWVSLYNGQKEFRPAGGARKGMCMAKISGEKKRAAVEFCIAHDRDYALTAERFGFTYQQVYGWVRKYHAAGVNSLRHERKYSGELSNRIAENKQLKTVNLELEMEAVLHQKLHAKAAVRRTSAACGRPLCIRPSKNCMRNADGLFISSALRQASAGPGITNGSTAP